MVATPKYVKFKPRTKTATATSANNANILDQVNDSHSRESSYETSHNRQAQVRGLKATNVNTAAISASAAGGFK
jgi:hypothetical protein